MKFHLKKNRISREFNFANRYTGKSSNLILAKVYSLKVVTFAALCVSFPSKSKAIVSPKHVLKLKALDQSIEERKKLFCHAIGKISPTFHERF